MRCWFSPCRNGFKGFVAYVPLEGTDEALMAVIEEKALTNRPVFQSLTGKGYGYTLSKDASYFSVALATGPDFMAREKAIMKLSCRDVYGI